MGTVTAVIDQVEEGKEMYILYFDGISIELNKKCFKNTGKPKVGDRFSVYEGKDEFGRRMIDMFLNGQVVYS